MDKKGVLINRLQEQYQQGADETSLLNTALLLVTELQYSQAAEPAAASGKVSVIMPVRPFEVVHNEHVQETNIEEEIANETIEEHKPEPTDEVLHKVMENNILPEADVELEVEQPAAQITEPEAIQTSSVSALAEEKYNDVLEEIPTLAQQQPKVVFELNDTHQSEEPSINDKLKSNQTETGNRINVEPIRDLRKAIGINDKYTFIRELFRNDEAAYERTLKTINNFNILPEAEYWIQREMKYKLGWDDNNPTVKTFYQLVRRRFS